MARTKRNQLRQAIRGDLLDQLERNGSTGKFYEDLVEDYMALWDAKCGLISDIKDRGEKVKVYTATSENIKTNDSVTDLLRTNAQMLKLLENLGLKPSMDEGRFDDEM